MKNIFSIIVFSGLLLLHLQVNAQESDYIMHKIKAGETLTMLAKQYNTNVGDIMRLNGWHADAKLEIGSNIKIPVSNKTTSAVKLDTAQKQTSIIIVEKPAGATYKVAKGDNLYQISQKFKVSIDELKTWNNLESGEVKVGQVLIVGNNAVSQASGTANNDNNTSAESADEIKEVQNDAANKNISGEKITTENSSQQENLIANSALPENEDYFSVGYARTVSGKSLQSMSGTGMTFKTTSGWADKKYYIIINNIQPGTIVKATASNGKSIYAKVLWNMQNVKHSKNIDFFISNAAAAALEMNHATFDINITYYK